MPQKTCGIPSELFVGYLDSEDISDEELNETDDHELTKMGVYRLEISSENFSDEELKILEMLESEGFSPSYIFNVGLEAIDRTHAHDVRMIFSAGLAEMAKRSR